MRRGLLALLILLGGSSFAWAQVQFLPPPGLATKADTKVTVTPDLVVTRLMTFDHNNDGRVAIAELSERMRPLVARGDSNGDEALDRSELQALAVAPLSAVRTQTGRVFGQAGGYSFGDDAGLSSRTHIEGALEDLRLASDKKDRALPIVRAYVDTVEQAAKAALISQMERLLSPPQLATFTALLNADQGRQLTLRNNEGTRQVFINVRGDLARRVEAMRLAAPTDEEARKAIDQFKTRTRLGNELDRAGLLAQLKDILSDEERDNYGAALARRPVVANGPQVLAFNDVTRRAQETFFGAAKPAVLIEHQTPVTIISR